MCGLSAIFWTRLCCSDVCQVGDALGLALHIVLLPQTTHGPGGDWDVSSGQCGPRGALWGCGAGQRCTPDHWTSPRHVPDVAGALAGEDPRDGLRAAAQLPS